jgi:hypothetical protein
LGFQGKIGVAFNLYRFGSGKIPLGILTEDPSEAATREAGGAGGDFRALSLEVVVGFPVGKWK